MNGMSGKYYVAASVFGRERSARPSFRYLSGVELYNFLNVA